MLNLNHKRLEVWKDSLCLVKAIYKITEKFPKSEIFGVSNQLRRASISVTSNIAEGASGKSPIERKRFYEISRSSLVEVDTQLIISSELNFITPNELEEFYEILNKIFAKISNLILKTI